MQLIKNVFSFMLIIGFIALLALGVKEAIQFIISQSYHFTEAQLTLYAILLTTIFCTFIISSAIRKGSQSNARQSILQQKIHFYNEIIGILIEKQSQAAEENTFKRNFEVVQKYLVLWGSTSVLVQLNKFQQSVNQYGQDGLEANKQLEKLIQEMRKDLGQGNIGLGSVKLTNMLFNHKKPAQGYEWKNEEHPEQVH